jgi:hypothetical protein
VAHVRPASRPKRIRHRHLQRFSERGERAWQEYQRTRVAVPLDAVFDRVEALFAKRIAELSRSGAGQP